MPPAPIFLPSVRGSGQRQHNSQIFESDIPFPEILQTIDSVYIYWDKYNLGDVIDDDAVMNLSALLKVIGITLILFTIVSILKKKRTEFILARARVLFVLWLIVGMRRIS